MQDNHNDRITVLNSLIAGGASAVIAKTTTAPLERVRIIQQTGGRSASFAVIQSVYVNEGLLGFWKGNTPAVMRIFPTYALRLTLFDRLKFFSKTDSFVTGLMSGCAAAFLTTAVTYPLDVIRTRMAASDHKVNRSLIDVVKTLSQQRAFYKGLTINLVENVPYVGITLGSYDYLKKQYPSVSPIMLGIGTGAAATISCYPLDTVRRYMVVNQDIKALPAMRLLYSEGWSRFYRGIGIAVVKAGPTVGIILTLNDYFRKILT